MHRPMYIKKRSNIFSLWNPVQISVRFFSHNLNHSYYKNGTCISKLSWKHSIKQSPPWLEKLVHNCLASLIITQHLLQLRSMWLNLWSPNQNSSDGSTWHNSFFACFVCIYELALNAAQVCSTLATIVPSFQPQFGRYTQILFPWMSFTLFWMVWFECVFRILLHSSCRLFMKMDLNVSLLWPCARFWPSLPSCTAMCLEHKWLSC
jgi:hypothetical protein